MAEYVLLPLLGWGSTDKGTPFEIGDRKEWTFYLRVSRVGTGGSITVDIETSPSLEEQDFTTLGTLGPIALDNTEASITAAGETPDISDWPDEDEYVRARITAVTGRVYADVRADALFLDPNNQNDTLLLTQETREWKDGLERVVAQAEADVVNMILLDSSRGELDVQLTWTGSHEAIRREIADQAEHIMKRMRVGRRNEFGSIEALRNMPLLMPNLGRRLRPFRVKRSVVWEGR